MGEELWRETQTKDRDQTELNISTKYRRQKHRDAVKKGRLAQKTRDDIEPTYGKDTVDSEMDFGGLEGKEKLSLGIEQGDLYY